MNRGQKFLCTRIDTLNPFFLRKVRYRKYPPRLEGIQRGMGIDTEDEFSPLALTQCKATPGEVGFPIQVNI